MIGKYICFVFVLLMLGSPMQSAKASRVRIHGSCCRAWRKSPSFSYGCKSRDDGRQMGATVRTNSLPDGSGVRITNLPVGVNVIVKATRNADWKQWVTLDSSSGHTVNKIATGNGEFVFDTWRFKNGDYVDVHVYHMKDNMGPWIENRYRVLYRPGDNKYKRPFQWHIGTNDLGANNWDNTEINFMWGP